MTDRLSWLLTYISFVVDRQWTFRSIIDIAIDNIHIGRRIFSVNHSGAQCLQPQVHRDPHACATRYFYVLAPVGFKNIKTPEISAKTTGQNMGLWPDERYVAMRNGTHFDLFSSEDRYIFCERCRSTIPTPPVHRRKDDTASSTGRYLAAPRMWLAACGPLASNRYFKTTWKQMIHYEFK